MFNKVVDLLKKARRKGRHIFIMGNGGSAAISAHFACDLMKVAGCKAFDLSSNTAVLTAYANDCGYQDVFMEQLKVLADKGDIIIGISASGESMNVLNAIRWANGAGIETIGFTGFDGGELRGVAKHSI